MRLYSGLMHQIAQPGSVVAITTVTKSTGILHLSWSAPGLDGFQGSVSGFYRIDYSSDPTHVFAPTTYVTEFATTTAPGNSSSYILTGLKANTTYFTRIYLADARKVVAETSKQSDESTLANVPVSPVLSGVFETSVTISWTLPGEGAEGYQLDASSSNFGALFSGATLVSSKTANGVVVTLTAEGLDSYTNYYFKLGSLNWQSDLNFTTVLGTRTLPGNPVPVTSLSLTGDRLNRKVLLTWTTPVYRAPAGVLIQVSTNPIASSPVNGTAYPDGHTFTDGSVISSSAAAASHLQTDLEIDTTKYFRLYTKNTDRLYSVEVSTYVVLDLPPMAPAGLSAKLEAGGSSITLRWGGVASNMDGSGFKKPLGSNGWELNRYAVYRSTVIGRANWVWVADLGVTASSYTAAIPDPTRTYYYKIDSKDNFGNDSDSAMAMDTQLNLYALGADGVTRLKIPDSLSGALLASGNRYGQDMLVRATDRASDIGGKIVKSVSFNSQLSPSGINAALDLTKSAELEVVLNYKIENGVVVPSAVPGILDAGLTPAEGAVAPLALDPAVGEFDAAKHLAAYWNNSDEYVKLFGRVDLFEKTVALNTAMLGTYQIRNVLRSAGFSFDIAAISNKAITPNGDGLNDTVVFIFDNPMDSSFNGKIYDMRGSFVSDMRTGPLLNGSLLWDGKAGGMAVPGGVYVYQIKAESKVFNGTVMVIR